MIRQVAVVGAGVMGSGIAQSLALRGFQVSLNDVDQGRLGGARNRILEGRFGLRRAVELQKLSQTELEAALGRITYTADLKEAVSGADLVIEAVFEDLELKVRLFRQLDVLSAGATILASNTSGFSIGSLAGATDRPELVIGWHWASPANVMRAAEIVTHPKVAETTVAAVIEAARSAGKNPIVVKDDPMHWGFVANRIFRAAAQEARAIVDAGLCDEAAVDQILKDGFRWPAGPFELLGRTRTNWEA